jgi:hypothetical protein
MNSWIWMTPVLLLPAILLLGRYTVRIRIEKGTGPFRFALSLRTPVPLCGLDYDTAAGGFRLVILNRPFPLHGRTRRSGNAKAAGAAPPGGKKAGKKGGIPRIRAGKEVLAEGWRFLRRMRRTVRLRRLTVRFSAGDPAWTGMLAGLAGPLFTLADKETKTEWIPDFRSDSASGSAEIEARFVMARFLAVGLGGAVRLAVVVRRNG